MPQENRSFIQQSPSSPQWPVQFRANGPIQQQSNTRACLVKFSVSQNINKLPQISICATIRNEKETRSSGGILETLKNPEGLNTMLNNTQRVLQAAEQLPQ